MRHGLGRGGGSCSDRLPPGQEVEDFRAGVGEGVGQARRDVNQGAVALDQPLPDLAGGGFPGDNAGPVEGVKPLGLAGVEVVAPGLARPDGDEVEGGKQDLRFLEPALPGEKAHAPGVGLDFAAQVDELNFIHVVSPLGRFAGTGWKACATFSGILHRMVRTAARPGIEQGPNSRIFQVARKFIGSRPSGEACRPLHFYRDLVE
jgi:hypothetical protein